MRKLSQILGEPRNERKRGRLRGLIEGETLIAYFTFIMDGGGKGTSAALVKDGITYVSASHWEAAGLKVVWDKSHQRAKFTGWGKR